MLVGLANTAIKEARERVRAAINAVGISWAERRVTVNLSPADIPKTGTGFDLALAVALLSAGGYINPALARGVVHIRGAEPGRLFAARAWGAAGS